MCASVDVVTIDVAFISLGHIFPALPPSSPLGLM
jgi:predicted rRNA methylase YqxC with S4 and FtsJ domains